MALLSMPRRLEANSSATSRAYAAFSACSSGLALSCKAVIVLFAGPPAMPQRTVCYLRLAGRTKVEWQQLHSGMMVTSHSAKGDEVITAAACWREVTVPDW